MILNIHNNPRDANHKHLPNSTHMDKKIGFWGYVTEVNSTTNRVTVQASTGQIFPGIPVYSQEWVVKEDGKDFVSGSRNLPPVNSRVFVIMPTYTASGAFVLCSGYAPGEKDTHNLYGNEQNKSEKNRILEKITQGGWHFQENYDSGKLTFESNDNNISIELMLKDETENSKTNPKGIKIKAWKHVININQNGIKLEADSDTTIDAGENKIVLNGKEIDLNGNSKSLVTYAALNTALSTFLSQLTMALTTTPIIGNGSPQTVWTSLPSSIDISAAEQKNVKVGG